MEQAPDTAEIHTQLQELRTEVEALRRELQRVRRHPGVSMRAQNRCPQCNGRSILHLRRVRDHNYGDAHTAMAIQLEGVFKKREIGAFELFVCRQCEFGEWYVSGAGEIDPEKLDKANRKNVRIIDEEPPDGGPFR